MYKYVHAMLYMASAMNYCTSLFGQVNLQDFCFQYMQKIGSADRSGQPSEAILHYCNADVAANVNGMKPQMVKCCKSTTFWVSVLQLLQYGLHVFNMCFIVKWCYTEYFNWLTKQKE